MTEENQLFTPKEAAAYLSKRAGREITVARLAQLRRLGRVKAKHQGGRMTVYTLEDLKNADVALYNFGRSSEGNEDKPLDPAA